MKARDGLVSKQTNPTLSLERNTGVCVVGGGGGGNEQSNSVTSYCGTGWLFSDQVGKKNKAPLNG